MTGGADTTTYTTDPKHPTIQNLCFAFVLRSAQYEPGNNKTQRTGNKAQTSNYTWLTRSKGRV